MFQIYLHPGIRSGLFTPDQAFDVVAKKQIARLKTPSLKLVDSCTQEMTIIARAVVEKVRCCPRCKSWDGKMLDVGGPESLSLVLRFP